MTTLFEGSDVWIVDALRYSRHPSHLSLGETLAWIKRLKPARAMGMATIKVESAAQALGELEALLGLPLETAALPERVCLVFGSEGPGLTDELVAAFGGLADPAAYGHLKAELVKIVDEQRGSDISQAFVIRKMEVDPAGLTSTVTGTLKTFVGATVIGSDERRGRSA